jgi:hypothetical protein
MRSRFKSRFQSRFVSRFAGVESVYRSTSGSFVAPGIAAPTLTITGGVTDTSLTPELNGSAFTLVGGASDTHQTTDWQISDDSGFSNIVWEAAASASLTQITVGLDLTDDTTYYARVRYNGSTYTSDWSATVTFNTLDVTVNTPSITSPSDAATDIGETPTITSSAFAVTGDTDSHASSDWQVASDSGFSTIVVQSLDDASNLESWTVPSGNLSTSTTYYVRVRHTGTTYGDSGWSSGVSFTTAASFGPTAQDVIDAMTTTPTAGRQTLITNLFDGLKSDGVLDKLDCLLVFMAHTEQAALINWVDPTGTAATKVGSPAFTADQGFSSITFLNYIDSQFDPSTATNMAPDNGCVGLRHGAPGVIGNAYLWFGGRTLCTVDADTDPDGDIGSNSFVEFSGAGISGWPKAGLTSIDRDAANSLKLYFDGLEAGTNTTDKTGLLSFTSETISVGARSVSSAQADIEVFWAGASLTSSEHAAIKSRIDTYVAGL